MPTNRLLETHVLYNRLPPHIVAKDSLQKQQFVEFSSGVSILNSDQFSDVLWMFSDKVVQGSPTSATVSKLVDSTIRFIPGLFVKYKVEIMSGPGHGQQRTISANTEHEMFVQKDFDAAPTTASVYRVTAVPRHARKGDIIQILEPTHVNTQQSFRIESINQATKTATLDEPMGSSATRLKYRLFLVSGNRFYNIGNKDEHGMRHYEGFISRVFRAFEAVLGQQEEKLDDYRDLVDINRCPPSKIPLLAFLVYVTFPEGLTDNSKRQFIQSTLDLYKKKGRKDVIEKFLSRITGNPFKLFTRLDFADFGPWDFTLKIVNTIGSDVTIDAILDVVNRYKPILAQIPANSVLFEHRIQEKMNAGDRIRAIEGLSAIWDDGENWDGVFDIKIKDHHGDVPLSWDGKARFWDAFELPSDELDALYGTEPIIKPPPPPHVPESWPAAFPVTGIVTSIENAAVSLGEKSMHVTINTDPGLPIEDGEILISNLITPQPDFGPLTGEDIFDTTLTLEISFDFSCVVDFTSIAFNHAALATTQEFMVMAVDLTGPVDNPGIIASQINMEVIQKWNADTDKIDVVARLTERIRNSNGPDPSTWEILNTMEQDIVTGLSEPSRDRLQIQFNRLSNGITFKPAIGPKIVELGFTIIQPAIVYSTTFRTSANNRSVLDATYNNMELNWLTDIGVHHLP